jgi:hypothetical protein|tara:strand:+ start:1154 stop:1387 length:234 start_codon:yes stop_codon:yes gene_type:complete
MNMSDKRTLIVLAIVAAIVVYLVVKNKEKYMPIGADYRYNTVDTNPERRTAGFFDHCSPENMADCSRNNPYEGLPLP